MLPTISQKFYSIFWENEPCREMFLMHKEQLLEKKEIDLGDIKKSFYLQRIVLSNSLKRNENNSRILQRIQNRNIELDHSLDLKTKKNFNERKIEKYIQDKFGKSIKTITDKLNGGNISQIRFLSELTRSTLSEKRVIKFLKKYHFIPENINSIDELGKSIEKIIETEISKILGSEHLVDIFKSLDEISDYYNNGIFDSLIDANQFYTDRIYDRENFKDRIALFDLLYEAGVLIGGKYKTYYECTHCQVGVFSGNVTLNVTPSKVKLKCPNCNKEVFYLAPFQICDEIFKQIQTKDGLLFVAIGFLLEKKKSKFSANQHYPPDVEVDFQLFNERNQITEIIEIKSYKTDRPGETQINNLREGLKSFIETRTKLVKSNSFFSNVKYHFVTNIRIEEYYKRLKEDFKRELEETSIIIHTPEEFKKYMGV